MGERKRILEHWEMRSVMLTWTSLLQKARLLECVPFPLQICLLQRQWRSLRSHSLALHLHRILPQGWALFPSTTIPEYLESRTVVRTFKFLSFTQQTLKGGGEVYHHCYGDYILPAAKGGLLMDKMFFFSYQFMRKYLILYNLINIFIWKFSFNHKNYYKWSISLS